MAEAPDAHLWMAMRSAFCRNRQVGRSSPCPPRGGTRSSAEPCSGTRPCSAAVGEKHTLRHHAVRQWHAPMVCGGGTELARTAPRNATDRTGAPPLGGRGGFTGCSSVRVRLMGCHLRPPASSHLRLLLHPHQRRVREPTDLSGYEIEGERRKLLDAADGHLHRP